MFLDFSRFPILIAWKFRVLIPLIDRLPRSTVHPKKKQPNKGKASSWFALPHSLVFFSFCWFFASNNCRNVSNQQEICFLFTSELQCLRQQKLTSSDLLGRKRPDFVVIVATLSANMCSSSFRNVSFMLIARHLHSAALSCFAVVREIHKNPRNVNSQLIEQVGVEDKWSFAIASCTILAETFSTSSRSIAMLIWRATWFTNVAIKFKLRKLIFFGSPHCPVVIIKVNYANEWISQTLSIPFGDISTKNLRNHNENWLHANNNNS